jgi:hypothetical protein
MGLAAATAAVTTGLIAAERPNDADCGDTGGFGDGELECEFLGGDDAAEYGVSEGEEEDAMEIGDASPGLDDMENVGENAPGSASSLRGAAMLMGEDAFIVTVLPLARTVCGGDGG